MWQQPESDPQQAYSSISRQLRGQRANVDAATNQQIGNIQQSYMSIADAMKQEATRQAELAKEQSIAMEQYNGELQKQQLTAADIAAREQARIDAGAKLEAGMRAELEDYKGSGVDPKRFWSSLDNGNKAQLVIATILSSIGQGLSGSTSNSALDVIDRYIEDDIQRQKEGIMKKADSIQESKNAYQRSLARFDDERVAEKNTRNLLMEGLKDKLAQIEISGATQDQKIKAQTLLAELSLKQNNEIASAIDSHNTKVVSNLNAQAQMADREVAADSAAMSQMATAGEQQLKDQEFDIPDMLRVKRVGANDAAKVRQLKGTHSQITSINAEIMDLRKKFKDSNYLKMLAPNELTDLASRWKADLTVAVKEFKNMGATFTDFEIALTDAMTAPSASSFSRVENALNRFQKSIDLELVAKSEPYGFADPGALIRLGQVDKLKKAAQATGADLNAIIAEKEPDAELKALGGRRVQ